MLNNIPTNFEIEKKVKLERIYSVNNQIIRKGWIVYLIEREFRLKDNFALNFANQISKEYGLPLKLLYNIQCFEVIGKNYFINSEIFYLGNIEAIKNKDILEYLQSINTSVLILDFNPILNRNYLKNAKFKIFEIDSHNIVPARFVSDKQEFNAQTFRRRIYKNLGFLTEYKNEKISSKNLADNILEEFIKKNLPNYVQDRNNPNKNVTSGLSKFLNWGFISSQRVALEVIKSPVSDENKEAFLEELIIRKELADNFCLYCKSFKNFSCIPNWAKETLEKHKNDFKPYIYSLVELEKSKTHDNLWNAAQKQLIQEGSIHSYLRMYWAKQILCWSKTPTIALKNAIYLNDKYAYDAPSSSGYVGILWSIGALHDRAFKEREIYGKIRPMTFNGAKAKFNVEKFILQYY